MDILQQKKIGITGGLGFIGFNLVKHLMNNGFTGQIVIVDNNSINNVPVIEFYNTLPNITVVYQDLLEAAALPAAIEGCDLIFHLAANSDISKGVFNPSIDFQNTVVATQNLLQAMLQAGVKNIIFSSGSGVYGDISDKYIPEDQGPLVPVSHYGASKLCAESMIAAFVFMHDLNAWIFRFANVVGDGQTHGVAYDFIRRLKANPDKLEVLGNGYQNKSYIHISDIINGIFTVVNKVGDKISYHNIATDDSITVRQIADIVVEAMQLQQTAVQYGETPFGWKGDVPVIKLSTERIKKTGWTSRYNSFEAMRAAVKSMLDEYK
jgi:UDP-glucose 4-epimerase